MFVELMPLLAGRTVLITVAKVDDKTLRVNVIPHGKADDNPALSTPLTYTGSPEELDAELGKHLAGYVKTHQQTASTLAEAKATMESAAKAAQEEAKRKADERKKATQKPPDKGTTSAAEPALASSSASPVPAEAAPSSASTGTVLDPKAKEVTYTEEGMNHGTKEKELPEKFGSPEYHVLLVAEKYQTGFDQALLHTMYVDKRLAGLQAVQTLSRLNRIHPLKEDTFVLDFVNDRAEIWEAFKTYYEGAEMGEEVDPARMYQIKAELDASGIYLPEELERFCQVYFKPKQWQSAADHQAMNAVLDPAVSRFTV
jgi:PRTRC genetic system protein E